MIQTSLEKLFGVSPKKVVSSASSLRIIDLFCGAGGFSTGSVQAGATVLYANDMDEDALETHRRNHPDAIHSSDKLPSAKIPFPTDGAPFHLHGSPPCQKFSSFNVGRNAKRKQGDREHAESLVEWFLRTAISCGATSWSMEEVGSKHVVAIVEKFRKEHKGLVDFDVFELQDFGVPQTRTRLIAGNPELIQRLRRAREECVRRSVKDVISNPRGTHIKNTRTTSSRVKRARPQTGEAKYIYKKARLDEGCHPISSFSPTVIAGVGNMWVTIEEGNAHSKLKLNASEAAALQTFPRTYKWPSKSTLATKQIGNAVPPLVAELLLAGKLGEDHFSI